MLNSTTYSRFRDIQLHGKPFNLQIPFKPPIHKKFTYIRQEIRKEPRTGPKTRRQICNWRNGNWVPLTSTASANLKQRHARTIDYDVKTADSDAEIKTQYR